VFATSITHITAAAAGIKVKPDPTALPGVSAAETLLDGLAKYVLIACAAGLLFGAAEWAMGSRSSNSPHAASGKTKMLVSLGGAFVVGAAPAILNFFLAAGGGVK
jgi:hypothetical protein